ncbi:MAG: hypothetical protein PHH30_08635, partial [Bacteroidales bacterium]|nr:hypothetical protein [Bacteroidales bacterium]
MNIAIYGRNFGNSFNGMAIQLLEELKNNNDSIYINQKFYDLLITKVFYTPKVVAIYENNLPEDVKFDFL